MSDWPTELAAAIRRAIDAPGETVIKVPNETRLALAQIALGRMSPGNQRVKFEVEA